MNIERGAANRDGTGAPYAGRTADGSIAKDTYYIVTFPQVRVEYIPKVDAAYIYLTGEPLTPGRDTVVCDLPVRSGDLTVVVDCKDGKIVGLEVPAASSVLPAQLLAQPQPPSASADTTSANTGD